MNTLQWRRIGGPTVTFVNDTREWRLRRTGVRGWDVFRAPDENAPYELVDNVKTFAEAKALVERAGGAAEKTRPRKRTAEEDRILMEAVELLMEAGNDELAARLENVAKGRDENDDGAGIRTADPLADVLARKETP